MEVEGGGGGGGGGGSQCGTPEKKLASGLCEPPGAPFSITIGSGAMPTSELPSHIEKRERSVVRGGARKKKDVKSKCVAAVAARGWH